MIKKERKIKNIRTYYLANEDFELQQKIEDLANRERVNLSNIIIDALKEYLKNHGDGNPAFTLDQFADPDFSVCPAFYRDGSIWEKYIKKADKKEAKAKREKEDELEKNND